LALICLSLSDGPRAAGITMGNRGGNSEAVGHRLTEARESRPHDRAVLTFEGSASACNS
jgi:hypothetical protein